MKTNENNPEHNSNGQQEQDCRSEVTTPAAECQGGPGVKSLIEGYSKNGTSKELQKSSQLAATTNQQQCDLVPPTRPDEKRRSLCITLAVPVSLLVYRTPTIHIVLSLQLIRILPCNYNFLLN